MTTSGALDAMEGFTRLAMTFTVTTQGSEVHHLFLGLWSAFSGLEFTHVISITMLLPACLESHYVEKANRASPSYFGYDFFSPRVE